VMTSPNLLFIEPQGKAAESPFIDDLTRRMTAAYRAAEPGSRMFCGVHTCACGAMSAARNYSLPDRRTTNSLCVHYLAHHRPDVPAEQLARVASLTCGLAEPSEEELRGGRWRGNRLGDFLGRDLVAAFAGGGLDLSNAYLETEGAAQEGAYHHHVLGSLASMPIKAVPVLIDAISQTDGGIDRWMASAFWPERWKEAWIAPLLTVLATADRDIRLWGVHSLGNLGDTLGTWRNYVFVGDDLKDVEVVRATGITGSQGRDVGNALLEVMLRDPDGKVRSAALRAISGLGAAGEAAVRSASEAAIRLVESQVRGPTLLES
jgi:hypothetical protein